MNPKVAAITDFLTMLLSHARELAISAGATPGMCVSLLLADAACTAMESGKTREEFLAVAEFAFSVAQSMHLHITDAKDITQGAQNDTQKN